MKPKILHVWLVCKVDCETTPDHEAEHDQASWHRGSWWYMGIQCKATVQLKSKKLILTSQGCWGVRHNNRHQIAGVEKEECDQLRDTLASLGFGHRAIEYAFKKITVDQVK